MKRPETIHVDKPWGCFEQFVLNTTCTVKILTCKPGQKLSLQKHAQRDELWIAMDDGVVVELDGERHFPAKGQEIWLPKGSVHRLSCDKSALEAVRVLEISLGQFDENDIERLEDNYGRVN